MNLTDALPLARVFAARKLGPATGKFAHVALDLIEEHEDAFAAEGKAQVQAVLARFAVGDLPGARRSFLANGASASQRRLASAEMTARVNADTEASEERWRSFEQGLLKLGVLGIRYGLMALVAVV
jgi:hypothetical protein